MNTKQARFKAIETTVSEVKAHLSGGVTQKGLGRAKKALMTLAGHKSLFPRSDFPVPDSEQIDRTFLAYEENDGSYALYVNSSLPGQSSHPHDHGGTWAIVAAVSGKETHRVYEVADRDAPESITNIRQVDEVVVQPETAIALMPDGIHSIHATSDEPLLHLHLYGKSYAHQGERKVYDLTKNVVRRFVLEDVGFVEDAR